MIFKRNNKGPNPEEPKTKSGLFEGARDTSAPAGLTSAPQAAANELEDEPPTRDAIFNDAPIMAKEEPPTGWAAVIAGPDKGQIIPLAYGETIFTIGKNPQDHKISYDAALTRFALHGKDTAQTLKARDEIKIGKNTLIFIPLCADGFDWRSS